MTIPELVEDLRARGVILEPSGDKLRVRPTSRLTAGELDVLREHKAEVLQLLAAPTLVEAVCHIFDGVVISSPARWTYSHPWPDTLPGLGPRQVVPFARCSGCGTGTWIRYGTLTRCLACARREAGP